MIYEHADGGRYSLVERGDFKRETDGAWVPGVAYRSLEDGRLRMTTAERFEERFKPVPRNEIPWVEEGYYLSRARLRSVLTDFSKRVDAAILEARSMNMDLALSEFSIDGRALTWSMFPIPFRETPPQDGRRWRIIHCADDE